MSYVEMCEKHGQHHGEICGECFDELKEDNTRLRKAVQLALELEQTGLVDFTKYQLTHSKDIERVYITALEEKMSQGYKSEATSVRNELEITEDMLAVADSALQTLTAENARLREALEVIADGTGRTSWSDQEIARAALEGK